MNITVIITNILILLVFFITIISVVRYWNSTFSKNGNVDTDKLPFSIFVISNIIAIFSLIFFSINDEMMMYLYQNNMVGENALKFWSMFGVIYLSIFIGYIIVFQLARIVFRFIVFNGKELIEQIESNDRNTIIQFAVIIISSSILFSKFTLKSFIFDILSSMIKIISIF